MRLDLRNVMFYVLNFEDDYESRSSMVNMLSRLNIKHQIIPKVKCDPETVGNSLSRLKVLELENLSVPFAIIEDSCVFNDQLKLCYEIPEETDALYLGQSRFGIPTPGQFGWGQFDQIQIKSYNQHFIRLYNNLAGHCIIFLSKKYHQNALRAGYDSLFSDAAPYPMSVGIAMLQKKHIVLSPFVNVSRQSAEFKGNQGSTDIPLYAMESTNRFRDIDKVSAPNAFLFTRFENRDFFLFYDVFVHWGRKKITAIAPYYGKDLDLSEEHKVITIQVGDLKIVGQYIPCVLDSWEPSILIDFEHPELEDLIQNQQQLEITVTCKDQENIFLLDTITPVYDISMSVIVKNENRWLPFFLEYYIDIMKADHVFLYDNMTEDFQGLKRILLPYIKKCQLTYIPWHFQWRNRIDRKQIGQPPQEGHSLNKYGLGKWMGFLDVDEFLHIPGQTLPGFMKQFDSALLGGVSFGLRWFFYNGPKEFEQITNPLVEFVESKRDDLGRKRQKLMVSPKLCRYMRFHWIPEDQVEHPVPDDDIFFHHYYIRKNRFDEGKSEKGKRNKKLAEIYRQHLEMNRLREEIEVCFQKAKREESKLTKDVLKLKGMIGTFTRHFYNNIASLGNTRLLEIGLYKGASSCCFLQGNMIRATLIDNWSEFGSHKEEAVNNIRKFTMASRVKIIEQDCFTIDPALLDQYNLYVYDGGHSYDDHYQAITKYYEYLTDIAIVVIDDWNRKSIRNATFQAIEDLNIPIFYEKEIVVNDQDIENMPRHNAKHTWWNGIYVFAINKNLKV